MFKLIAILVFTSLVNGAPKYSYNSDPNGGRIIGGHDADIENYPYQLSLIYQDFGSFCGAVLISPEWALTAAHCTYDIVAANLSIRAGSSLRDSDDGQLVQVSQIIQHQNFNYESGDHDISLLLLAANITIANATPIAIARNTPKAGDTASITGWGVTNEAGTSVAEVLQVVEVPVISYEDCKTAYAVRNQAITDTMFCAGYLGEGGKDACTGDSGGPIVVGGVLSGLVSWGIGCAEAEFPGVYTDVSVLRDWIQENSGITL